MKRLALAISLCVLPMWPQFELGSIVGVVTDPAKVAAALRTGKYDSTVGVLEFDQKGDIKQPVYDIYIWKDGNYAPIKK